MPRMPAPARILELRGLLHVSPPGLLCVKTDEATEEMKAGGFRQSTRKDGRSSATPHSHSHLPPPTEKQEPWCGDGRIHRLAVWPTGARSPLTRPAQRLGGEGGRTASLGGSSVSRLLGVVRTRVEGGLCRPCTFRVQPMTGTARNLRNRATTVAAQSLVFGPRPFHTATLRFSAAIVIHTLDQSTLEHRRWRFQGVTLAHFCFPWQPDSSVRGSSP